MIVLFADLGDGDICVGQVREALLAR